MMPFEADDAVQSRPQWRAIAMIDTLKPSSSPARAPALVAALLVAAAFVSASCATDIGPMSADKMAAIQAGPTFTPMTVRPEITNQDEIVEALNGEYPENFREQGIGGRVVVLFYIDETGRVLDTRVARSSGSEPLDEAALRVADVYEFTAALNRDDPVPVWIQLPVTFQSRN